MIDLESIQLFLKKLQPKWSFVKVAFIAYLMYSLLKRHSESINPSYKKIQQTNKYTLWFDSDSNSYALELDNSIIPLDKKDDVQKYI